MKVKLRKPLDNILREEKLIIPHPAYPPVPPGHSKPLPDTSKKEDRGDVLTIKLGKKGGRPGLQDNTPSRGQCRPLQRQPAKRPHPCRDLGEEKVAQWPGHGRPRHLRMPPRPKEAPHYSGPHTHQTSSSPPHANLCKRKRGAKAEMRSGSSRQNLPHNIIRRRGGEASQGPEHGNVSIEDARKALTKHSWRIRPPNGITVNPTAQEEAQVQVHEGTDGRLPGTGRQTEHTNKNYKRARKKL